MIKTIELQNWKTHLNSRFEFSNGTNLLVGAMGSGKTSVMDAICFALFGTFPSLQQRKLSQQEIIMAKPNKMDFARVKLEFDYNGQEYAVERVIKEKGGTEAKFYISKKFTAGPKPNDVNKAIENAIEINYNLFSRAVYSEQNQIDHFLRLSPGQRKEKFDELLELDRYEKVRSSAVSTQNRLNGIMTDKSAWLGELKKEFKGSDAKELEKKKEEKEKLLKELNEKEKSLAKETESLKKEVSELEQKEKEFRELSESVSKKSYLAEQLAKEVGNTGKELKGLDAEVIEKSIEGRNEELKKKRSEIDGLEKKEKEIIEKASAAKQEIKGNELKVKELKEQTAGVKGVEGNCPVCKTLLDKGKKEHIEKENRELEEKLGEKNKKISEEIEKFEKEQEKLGKERGAAEKEESAVEEKVVELKRLLELAKKLGEKKVQAEKLGKEAKDTRARIEKLGFDEAKAKKAKDDAIRTESAVGSCKKEQASVKEILAFVENEIEKSKKNEEQIKELEASVKAIEKSLEKLNLFVNSLRETQAQLRESLIETINEAMDQIWQDIYPYKDYSSAMMAVEDGNYELVVKNREGNWERVEGILSGGERSSAAICIRIAFSLVLTRNLSWMILDEPTHNLDTTAVSCLSKMMRESLPKIIEQVFVITHDKEMEKAASGTLYVLNRNKSVDGPTKAESIALES